MSFDFSVEEESEVKLFLSNFKIIDTSSEIAEQSLFNRKLRKIKIPDNIIASTAQVYNLILLTRNISDFKSLELDIVDIMEEND